MKKYFLVVSLAILFSATAQTATGPYKAAPDATGPYKIAPDATGPYSVLLSVLTSILF